MVSELAVDLLVLKKVALIFFLCLWLLIVVRLVIARRGRYERDAMIPLDDERPIEPRNQTT